MVIKRNEVVKFLEQFEKDVTESGVPVQTTVGFEDSVSGYKVTVSYNGTRRTIEIERKLSEIIIDDLKTGKVDAEVILFDFMDAALFDVPKNYKTEWKEILQALRKPKKGHSDIVLSDLLDHSIGGVSIDYVPKPITSVSLYYETAAYLEAGQKFMHISDKLLNERSLKLTPIINENQFYKDEKFYKPYQLLINKLKKDVTKLIKGQAVKAVKAVKVKILKAFISGNSFKGCSNNR